MGVRIARLSAGPAASFRHDRLFGRDVLVVPVVALREGVIRAMNSPGPELVPAEEIAAAAHAWNGRPVTAGHPQRAGRVIPANDPEVWNQELLGWVFGARVDEGKLLVEAWLDPSLARPESEAARTVARLMSGEQVEVSVGVTVSAETTQGEWRGQPYVGIWRDIVPDHVAFLGEGEIGACSLEMGCGAPRAASSAACERDVREGDPVTRSGEERAAGVVPPHREGMTELAPRDVAWEAPTLADFTARGWDELSDSEKRDIAAHFAWSATMPPERFGDLKLPHHRPSDGRVVFRGVTAALGRLDQTDIPDADVAAVRAHLEAHREAFAREAQGEAMTSKGWWHKVASLIGWRRAVDVDRLTDEELRNLLTEALSKLEPAFVGIVAVRPGPREVIYGTDPEPHGDAPLQFWQRAFDVSEDGTVTFGDRVEVRTKTEWEPVDAAAPTTAARAAECACQRGQDGQAAQSGQDGQGDTSMGRNAERIAALIADAATPWSESDRAYLESLSDEALDRAASAILRPSDEAGWLAIAPESVRRELEAARRAAAERREAKVKELLGIARGVYDAAELAAMSEEQLDRLAAWARAAAEAAQAAVDHSAKPVRAAGTPLGPPPPIDLAARLTAQR